MKNFGYYLRFVKASKATTDGASDVVQLIQQRRRWYNGTHFSMLRLVFRKERLQEIWGSGHSCLRKLTLTF